MIEPHHTFCSREHDKWHQPLILWSFVHTSSRTSSNVTCLVSWVNISCKKNSKGHKIFQFKILKKIEQKKRRSKRKYERKVFIAQLFDHIWFCCQTSHMVPKRTRAFVLWCFFFFLGIWRTRYICYVMYMVYYILL